MEGDLDIEFTTNYELWTANMINYFKSLDLREAIEQDNDVHELVENFILPQNEIS